MKKEKNLSDMFNELGIVRINSDGSYITKDGSHIRYKPCDEIALKKDTTFPNTPKEGILDRKYLLTL